MKKILLLIVMLCTLLSAGAATYNLWAWKSTSSSNYSELATALYNAGIIASTSDQSVAFQSGNSTGIYYINVPNGFTLSKASQYGLKINTTWEGGTSVSKDAWSSSATFNTSGGNGTIPAGTYYGITLYVSGSNYRLYFSTSSVNPTKSYYDTQYFQLKTVTGGAFTDYSDKEFDYTGTTGIYSITLGTSGTLGTGGATGFYINNGTADLKASTSTTCANTFVAGSTSGTNNFIVDADKTYYKLFFKTSDNSVCATTIPSTISFTPTATVSGGTVTLNANPTQITDANPAFVTGYSIKCDGTTLSGAEVNSTTGAMKEFTNSNVTNGTHTYVITVTYKECVGGPDCTATGTVSATVTDGVEVEVNSDYYLNLWSGNGMGLGTSAMQFKGTSYTGYYTIKVPAGFTATSSAKFGAYYQSNSNYHKDASFTADTWGTLGGNTSSDATLAAGTYYGITLYVSGSTWKLYFSTNPDIPVLTPNNFINGLTSTPQTPIIGERTVGTVTSGYNEHYRLTFPGTQIGWNKAALPDTYTFDYSTTINGKTFSSANFTANNLKLYGLYGQTDAKVTFTIHPSSGDAITVNKTVALDYFGHLASDFANYVNVNAATPYFFKNGYLVANIDASDNATAGFKASFYEPLRTAVDVTPTAMSDFTTAINPYTYHDIVTVDEMKARKAFLLIPSFTDLYQKGVTSVTSNFTIYYVSKPHYFMVKLPFTQAEMDAMVTSVDATTNIGSLQDGSSSAPALNPEKVGSARIKAISGSYLYGTTYVEDVPVEVLTSSTNTNDHIVSFTTDMVKTGVEGVAVANVSIVGGEGMITISGATNGVIYDITGRTVANVNGDNTVNVPAGVYIVKVGTTTKKVAVK